MWQGPQAATLPEGTLHSNTFANSGIPLTPCTHHQMAVGWLSPPFVGAAQGVPSWWLTGCALVYAPTGGVEPAVRLYEHGAAFKPRLLAWPIK